MKTKAIKAESDILLLVVKVPASVFENAELVTALTDDLKEKIEAGGHKCPPIKTIHEGMDITPIRMTGGQTCAAS